MARSRSMTAGLSRLLSDSPAPVYVVDEKRVLVYVNAAFERWLQIDGEAIVGRRCDYTAVAGDDRLAALAAAICPPPAALAGELAVATLHCPLADGEFSRRRARFLPLGEDAIDCDGVLAGVAPEETDAAEADADEDLGAPGSPPRDVLPEHERLHRQLQQFRRTLAGKYRLDRLIGKTAAMLRVRRQVGIAIGSRAHAVLIGPPGSGREHVARTIAFAGGVGDAPPLMPLASPLLDAESLQSSITAFVRQAGERGAAGPPTLLLCDADQLGAGGQSELAGFLALPGFDVRVLATSRESLLKLSEQGEYRRDLAYALSTLEIILPPLVERRRDIPLLAQMFVEEHNAAGGAQLAGFSSAALDVLCEHTWDEDIDQLREAVFEACAAAVGSEIARDELPGRLLLTAATPAAAPPRDEAIVLDDLLADVEAQMIRRAMHIAKGNKTKAAELLNISRPRLHRRWEELEREG